MRSGRAIVLSDYIGGDGPGSGGAGHAALDSYNALRAAGADVRAIAGFGAGQGIAPERFASLDGEDLRDRGVGGMMRAIYNPAAKTALVASLANCDPDTTLIILHQWTRYLSPAALRIVAHYPTMIYMHDYFWPCPNGLYYDFRAGEPCTRRPMHAACLGADCDRHGRVQKLGRVMRQAVRQVVSRSDPARRLFLHLSEHAQRTATPLLPRERHAILYNPLPLGDAVPPVPRSTHDVGYFGRLESDKGVDLLVDALATTQYSGLFVGAGALEPRLAGVRGITHRPWQPRGTMAAAMRSCGVVVLPSRWDETWGLIVPEAMAAGVPVLVSSRAGSAELIRRFGGGRTFDPGVLGDLAATLTAMLSQPPAPTRMHDALRTFLSPERHAARVIQLAQSHFGLDLRATPGRISARAAFPAPLPA